MKLRLWLQVGLIASLKGEHKHDIVEKVREEGRQRGGGQREGAAEGKVRECGKGQMLPEMCSPAAPPG